MRWKPISTAPKDGRPILILDMTDPADLEYAVVYWVEDSTYPGWTQDGGDRYRATHWMPLPDPPSAAR